MLVSRDRFAQGRTLRVKLLADQKIKAVPLNKGDEVDLEFGEAQYLKSIGRAEIVTEPSADPVKKTVTR